MLGKDWRCAGLGTEVGTEQNSLQILGEWDVSLGCGA